MNLSHSVASLFYDKVQVDQFLSGKADLVHTHSEFTNFDNTLLLHLSAKLDVSPDLTSAVRSDGVVGITINSEPHVYNINELDINSGHTLTVGASSTSNVVLSPGVIPSDPSLTISGWSPRLSQMSGAYFIQADSCSALTVPAIPSSAYASSVWLNNNPVFNNVGGKHVYSSIITQATTFADIRSGYYNSKSLSSLKKNIVKMSITADEILSGINVAEYSYIGEAKRRIGVIADELHTLMSGEGHDKMNLNNCIMCAILAIQDIARIQDNMVGGAA
jgi:hypothetical protein